MMHLHLHFSVNFTYFVSIFRFHCSAYLYKNTFKFYVKIHLADKTQQSGGGHPKGAVNTAAGYSEPRTGSKAIFHRG